MAQTVGHDDGVADHNAVYIDTSLGTHLAMNVSESDTVSDFIKKIVLEHRQMFPAIGDFKIECLKVKLRGNFYQLADSMLVKSAFDATKRYWFLWADVSRLEQNDGIQQPGKQKVGDQLALPWVTLSRSIERHDNHGSPSIHSKIVPFVSQKVFNADQLTSGDSCKDTSKNAEIDRSYNDKHLDYELQEKLYTVHTDISSKKRTHDLHNESSLKDAFEFGPSLKKKRKTHRVKSNVKALEDNIASTYDNDKVNDKGASINNEDSFEHKSKGKDLTGESNKLNKGEKCSALDQVANVVPSNEGHRSENVGDVAMIVENKSQQENEIDSLLMRTPDCEHDAAGVTAVSHMKRLTKHKAAKKNVGSNGQECAGDQIDESKDDSEISLKQRPELKLPERKKGTMGRENIGEVKRKKTRRLLKHSDNLLGDISSTIPASVTKERKTNEDPENTLVQAKNGDDVSVNAVGVSLEDMEEKSRREITDINDVVTVTNEENLLPHSESLMNSDAEVSTEKNLSQVNAQGILDDLEKQNEKTDDTMKKKRKKKTKKSAERNEEKSITKHVNGDIYENVKDSGNDFPNANRNDGDTSLRFLASVALVIEESKMNEVLGKTLTDAKKGDDVIVNEAEVFVENMEENSRKKFTDTNDVATVRNEKNLVPNSESLMNIDADISTTGRNISQVNAQGILGNLENQNEKMEDTTKKKKKKKMKPKKSAGRNEDESIAMVANRDVCENAKDGSLLDADIKYGDVSLTVLASILDEKQMKVVSGKTLIDADKGDDVIVKEVGISVENMEENSRKKFTDTNDVATVRNEENLLPNSESLMNIDADISTTRRNISQVNAQGILANLENQNEKMEDTTKKKKKKKMKTKKSAGRNEDESIAMLANRGVCENAKDGSLPDADRKDGDVSLTVLASVMDEKQMKEVSGKTLIDADKGDDVIVKEVGISVENMEENSRKEATDPNDVATVTNEENLLPRSESLMNNDAEITTGKNTIKVTAQLENENEKVVDTTKKTKKRKTRKSAGRIEDETITKHVNRDICENVKEGESNKSQDLPIKHQLTEVELESKKSQSIDHHHLPEKTLRNVTVSAVPKFNNKVEVSEDGSHELDSSDNFAPGRQQKKITSVDTRKDMKKTKDDSRNDQSQKLVLKNVNNKVSSDVLKDPNISNIDKIKTRQRTKMIDSQKINKQQSNVGQTRTKTMKKKSVNSSQQAKSLLNAPAAIFGDDSDDNATANSDSSTRTPSGKLSSSSSSEEECAFSIVSRRNKSHSSIGKEGAGKNNMNSKLGQLNDLIRSASSFKKVKASASSQVEDTESQPVDFVPDSQPMGK